MDVWFCMCRVACVCGWVAWGVMYGCVGCVGGWMTGGGVGDRLYQYGCVVEVMGVQVME